MPLLASSMGPWPRAGKTSGRPAARPRAWFLACAAILALPAWAAEVLFVGPELGRSTEVVARLQAAGLTVRSAEAEALDALDPVRTATVVLGADRSLPPASRLGLSRYLAAGGGIAVVGAGQFDYAPRPANPMALPEAAEPDCRLVAPERKNGGRKVALAEPARLQAVRTPDGRPALEFRTYVRGMQDFLVEFDAAKARSARRTVLTFWARGDAYMDLLALEIRDTAGRRWCGFVPLGRDWQQHAVSLADFLPDGWGDPATPYPLLAPETIATIGVGTNMATVWPERPMSFAIGGLALAEDRNGTYAPTSALAALRLPFLENGQAIPRWLFDPFLRSFPATGTEIRIGESARALPVSEAWFCPVPYVEHPGPRMGTDHRKDYLLKFQREYRTIPLWRTAPNATATGNVAEIRLMSTGPERGSAVALFGVRPATVLSQPALLASFIDAVITVATRPVVAGVTVDLQPPRGAEGSPTPALLVVVRNPLDRTVSGRLRADVAGVVRGEAPVQLRARGISTVTVPLSEVPADFPFARFDWRVALTTPAQIDTFADRVDVERALIYALRHLVNTQRQFPDGRMSHHYFGDAYGARAMFAYSDLLRRQPARLEANRDLWATVSPEEITTCGERFFDMIVQRQNEEGSFPMGYSEHLNVYNVADGGQIALSLAQSAPLARDPVRRESYLQAARRFVDWAETFYIDEKRSKELTVKEAKAAAKGETAPGLYGLGWGHLVRNETGPFWVLGDLLGVQMLLTHLDPNPDYRRIAARNLRHYLDAGYRADGYFWAEGLFWSWLTTRDDADRQRIAATIGNSFIGTLLKGDAHDMYDRGARANLNALPLLYYRRHFADSGALRAAELKYVWAFASEDAPNAMRRVSATFPKPAHGESIAAAKQAAFGAIWAIELLDPGASLLRATAP